MESILLSMLFIYPGALVDLILITVAYNKFTDEDMPQTRRLARYFVFSTIISVLSLVLFSLISSGELKSLTVIIDSLKTEWNFILYFGISLISTLLFTGLYSGGRKLGNKIYNLRCKKKRGYKKADTKRVWNELLEDSGIDKGNLIACIKKDGKMVVAGGIKAFPLDFQKDPALLLDWTKYITAEYIKDADNDKRVFKDPYVEYLHLQSGFVIEIFDGTEFFAEKLATEKGA